MTTDVALPTMVSELVNRLAEFILKYGDMPICADGMDYRTARVYISQEEKYYDGGCLMPCEVNGYHSQHWVRSRNQRWPYICRIRVDEPCEEEDTIDGVPLGPEKD